MDSPQPLRIHFGNTNLVLLNGRPLEHLVEFQLHASTSAPLRTHYGVLAAYPNKLGVAPDDALSNQAYPLRITAGDTTASVRVIYKNRPLGQLKSVFVHLYIDDLTGKPKRVLRITAYAMDEELRNILLGFGAEIIIEPPESECH